MALSRTVYPPLFLPPVTPANLPLHRCPVPRDRASHRILILRAGAFGDILMGTPLLAALRAAYPGAYITWIAEYNQADAINASPYIDEYLRWDGAYWKKMTRRGQYPLWLFRALRFGRTLRAKHYDVFISFQPEEWPLLVYGVNAKVNIGIFDTFRRFYGAAKTSGNTRLYQHAFSEPNLPAHRIDQYSLVLKALGLFEDVSRQMSMGYTEEDADVAAAFLTAQGVGPDERLVVLAPFTTWPTKCWPVGRYVTLGDALARQGCRVLVSGSPGEREAVQALAAQMQTPPVVASHLSFREMAAVIDRAALVVSGDTGPMHVAAALGTPQVAVFGPTSPAWYGPRTGRFVSLLHPVPCGAVRQETVPQPRRPASVYEPANRGGSAGGGQKSAATLCKQVMTRILIIKLWALGDILMATPLLTALHALPGGAEITWVADVAYAPLLENHPLIKEVVAVDTGAWRRLLRRGKLLAWLKESRRLRREMKARRFDAALNFHPEKWWLRILCAAPVRIGLSNEMQWGPLTRRLYTKAVPRTPDARHSTDRYLDAARALGLSGPFDRHMVLRPSAEDVAAARAFLESCLEHRPGLPIIILHPGTSRETKCWPLESFAALCAALSETHSIVLTGSGSESALCREVVATLPPGTPPPIVAAGELKRIGLTVALVSQAQAVVTGDTALLHIASALETPVVGIYGSTRPGDNVPLFGPHVLLFDDSVPCAPCYLDYCPLKGAVHLRCLHAVTPAQVAAALEKIAPPAPNSGGAR